MFMPCSGFPIRFKELQDAAFSICKIVVSDGVDRWSGTGFFVRLPLHSGTKRGLITNNLVLSYENIQQGSIFHVKIDLNEKKFYRITITPEKFRFTSDLLDVTFIELSNQDINYIGKIKFLDTCADEVSVNSRINIFQHPGGDDLSFSQGRIRSFWGIPNGDLISATQHRQSMDHQVLHY